MGMIEVLKAILGRMGGKKPEQGTMPHNWDFSGTFKNRGEGSGQPTLFDFEEHFGAGRLASFVRIKVDATPTKVEIEGYGQSRQPYSEGMTANVPLKMYGAIRKLWITPNSEDDTFFLWASSNEGTEMTDGDAGSQTTSETGIPLIMPH